MVKISDNPDLKSLLRDAEAIEGLANFLLSLNPNLAESITEITQNARSVVTIADDFNALFSKHGWIATDDMSVPLMKQAVDIFHASGIGNAEAFLCKSFDDAYYSLHSRRMQAIWVWKDTPRSRLLDLAYEDHRAGRYHASVPVVLAQIDGLSFDTNKASFFDKKSALVIENTIASHRVWSPNSLRYS